MKIKERRFNVPFAVFADIDRMPRPALVILLYLLSKSDFSGFCRTTYACIMTACNIGSRDTVWKSLNLLQKLGWIDDRKKTMTDTRIRIQIPPRLCQMIPTGVLPSDVIRMPKQGAR